MPKSWQYPRWRRVAMQVAMCVVLGAAVGSAAWVGQTRRAELDVKLGPPQQVGELMVRLPERWQSRITRGRTVVVVVADEVSDRRGDRQLRISQVPQDPPFHDPRQFLEELNPRPLQDVEPLPMLGQNGVLGRLSLGTVDPATGERQNLHKLFAAVVLRDGLTVVVELQSNQSLGPSSERLVRELAGDLARVTAGEVI